MDDGGCTSGLGSFFLVATAGAAAFPVVSSASLISVSWFAALDARERLGATAELREGAELAREEDWVFGGPGAIGTTPDLLAAAAAAPAWPLAVALLTGPAVDLGDSEPNALAFPELGVVAGVWAIEFLREFFLDDRLDDPTGTLLPLPRFRFLMTSVLSDKGRTTPCSFKNSPQALHSGCPSGLRLQRGVVWVKQLVQVVGTPA